MKKTRQAVIIVTAYGEDNYFQKRYEDIVGIYTNVKNAIQGAKADGMTKKQFDQLNKMDSFYFLDKALHENKSEVAQVEYYDETDGRCKPCTSSYMFRTYFLD